MVPTLGKTINEDLAVNNSKRASVMDLVNTSHSLPLIRAPVITQYSFTISMLGDCAVGKSSFLNTFIKEMYSSEAELTVLPEVHDKHMQVAGKSIRLRIIDTSGHFAYREMTQSYLFCSHGALILYSNSREDKSEVQESIKFLNNVANQHGKRGIVKLLVFNEIRYERNEPSKFSTEDGKKLADSLGIQFNESAADDFSKVEATFTALVSELLLKVETKELAYEPPTRKAAKQKVENRGFFQKVRDFLVG